MNTRVTSLDRQSATLGNWRTEFERIYAAPQYWRSAKAGLDPKRASWFVALIVRICDMVQEWHERAQSRRLLGSLDEPVRKDVGLSNADVVYESDKPFWRH